MAGEHSGRYSVVNGQSSMRQWTISEVSEPKKAVASNTKSGSARRKGVLDWTGNVQNFGGSPIVMPGETFTFEGYTAPDTDVAGTVGTKYTGPAIVDQAVITWNWETAEIISHQINFSSMGPLVPSAAAAALVDASLPDFQTTMNDLARITIGVPAIKGNDAEWCGIRTAVLTITAENKAYVNSCTGGYRARVPGPIDYTLAVTVHDDNPRVDLGKVVGDDVLLHLYVNDTEYWLLKWAHLRSIDGLTVNRESGDIIGATINFDMSGFDLAGAAGEIRMPGVVAPTDPWWPVAAA